MVEVTKIRVMGAKNFCISNDGENRVQGVIWVPDLSPIYSITGSNRLLFIKSIQRVEVDERIVAWVDVGYPQSNLFEILGKKCISGESV